MKLIDKEALVAEIKRRKEKCDTFYNIALSNNVEFAKVAIKEQKKQYDSFLSFLDTLEVKEVDNVWHDVNETPKGAGDGEILVQFSDSHASVVEIDDWEYLDHQTKWAYLKDLI